MRAAGMTPAQIAVAHLVPVATPPALPEPPAPPSVSPWGDYGNIRTPELFRWEGGVCRARAVPLFHPRTA